MSKKKLKKYGFSTNVIYDGKHMIYNHQSKLMTSFGTKKIIVNNTDKTVVLDGNKIDFNINNDNVEANNQLYVRRDDEYIRIIQSECFPTVNLNENIHTQIAFNVDKIKKSIAYYINNIIYSLNRVGGYQNEDVISVINYRKSWDFYDPSKGSSSIQTKEDFNIFIYNIASHNSLYNNIFKFKNHWSLDDYLSASDEVHEYNYDIMRIISLLRNYTAHGNENNRHSLYVLASTNELLKDNIEKNENLEKILNYKLLNDKKFILKEIEEKANTIFKTIKIFYIQWVTRYKEIDEKYFNRIVERLFDKKSDFMFSLKKLSRVFISKTINIKEKHYHRYNKYYTYLTNNEKKLFEDVVYFYLLDIITYYKIDNQLKNIYIQRLNYDDLFNWLIANKAKNQKLNYVPLPSINQLVKIFYIICKKEIRLYAKRVNSEVYNKNRGFEIDIHEAEFKEIYDEVFLCKYFSIKAQLLCNINKVAIYKEGQLVRDLSYHGQKLQKNKIWSILEYIEKDEKKSYWRRTDRYFDDDYRKQQYIQKRNSICKRVFLTILYTNKKYYNEYVWNFNEHNSFSDYLNDKSIRFNKQIVKSLLYDYDHLKIKGMKYSGLWEIGDVSTFSSIVFFISNFIDKNNAQMLADTINRRLENINGLTNIWSQLNTNDLNYRNTLSIFNSSLKILDDMYLIKSLIKLSKVRADTYEQCTSFISRCLVSMKVDKTFITNNLLRSIYHNTKYYNSLIKYIDSSKIQEIVFNKKLMMFGINTLNENEKQKYSKGMKIEDLVMYISKIQDLKEEKDIVFVMSLIGSILNSIVSKLIGINSKYYIAFACLERDLIIKFGSTNNFYRINGRQAMLLSDNYISTLDESKSKYINEFDRRRLIYSQNTFNDYRNTIEHINVIDGIYDLSSIHKIDSFFTLYHYLIQKYLFENARSFINTANYNSFKDDFNNFGTPSRELIKVINLPFAYNPARYNMLSYKSVFIKMEDKFDDRKRFF